MSAGAPPFMLADPIVIELAGEPRGKGRPRFSRERGVAYTPARTRSYESDLRLAAQTVMDGREPLGGALRVRVEALFPVPASWSRKKREQALAGHVRPAKRPDWENIAKMLDAFNQVVWVDDAQVVEGTIHKRYDARPALRIEVEAIALGAAA